jgi:hypothetical protein
MHVIRHNAKRQQIVNLRVTKMDRGSHQIGNCRILEPFRISYSLVQGIINPIDVLGIPIPLQPIPLDDILD